MQLQAEAPDGAEADPFEAEELAEAAKVRAQGRQEGQEEGQQEGQEIEVTRRRRRRGSSDGND